MRVQRTLGMIPTSGQRMSEINAYVLGGNVSYGHTMDNTDQDLNLKVWKATGTSPVTPDTDFTINHDLGQVPLTIVGQDTDNGGLIYRGSVPWTTTQVTLRSTKASSVFNVILA